MAREKKIIDASIIVKWFVNENDSEKALKLLDEHVNGQTLLVVPELMFIEVLNALRYKGQTTEALTKANNALTDVQFHVERLNKFLLDKAIESALKNNISLYDAVYVSLANLYGAPLITADKALQKIPNTTML